MCVNNWHYELFLFDWSRHQQVSSNILSLRQIFTYVHQYIINIFKTMHRQLAPLANIKSFVIFFLSSFFIKFLYVAPHTNIHIIFDRFQRVYECFHLLWAGLIREICALCYWHRVIIHNDVKLRGYRISCYSYVNKSSHHFVEFLFKVQHDKNEKKKKNTISLMFCVFSSSLVTIKCDSYVKIMRKLISLCLSFDHRVVFYVDDFMLMKYSRLYLGVVLNLN